MSFEESLPTLIVNFFNVRDNMNNGPEPLMTFLNLKHCKKNFVIFHLF